MPDAALHARLTDFQQKCRVAAQRARYKRDFADPRVEDLFYRTFRSPPGSTAWRARAEVFDAVADALGKILYPPPPQPQRLSCAVVREEDEEHGSLQDEAGRDD